MQKSSVALFTAVAALCVAVTAPHRDSRTFAADKAASDVSRPDPASPGAAISETPSTSDRPVYSATSNAAPTPGFAVTVSVTLPRPKTAKARDSVSSNQDTRAPARAAGDRITVFESHSQRPWPAANLNSPPAATGSGQQSGLVFELAPGVPLPVVFLESDPSAPRQPPESPEQAAALDQIAEDFSREISRTVASPATDDGALDAAWSEAQARADRRYQLLFGDAAYNAASMRAAREALAKQAR
jgi:hypothetical protein